MLRDEKKLVADELLWFAMSTARKPVMKVKAELDAKGIENYVAMQYIVEMVNGRKTKLLKPALNNLIFVHTRKSIIQRVKSTMTHLFYMIRPVEGHNIPIVISDEEMQSFIAVTSAINKNVSFVSPDDPNLKEGVRVRVLEGPFAGSEGVLVKLKGHRNRRLVVSVDKLAAASVEVSPSAVEIVTNG